MQKLLKLCEKQNKIREKTTEKRRENHTRIERRSVKEKQRVWERESERAGKSQLENV